MNVKIVIPFIVRLLFCSTSIMTSSFSLHNALHLAFSFAYSKENTYHLDISYYLYIFALAIRCVISLHDKARRQMSRLINVNKLIAFDCSCLTYLLLLLLLQFKQLCVCFFNVRCSLFSMQSVTLHFVERTSR